MPKKTSYVGLTIFNVTQDSNTKFIDYISDISGDNNQSNMVIIDKKLEEKLDRVNIGIPNGVAPLGSNGIVPSTFLPSYVDSVREYPTLSDFPAAGENGVIYVALDTGYIYRWGQTQYTPISTTVAESVDGGRY